MRKKTVLLFVCVLTVFLVVCDFHVPVNKRQSNKLNQENKETQTPELGAFPAVSRTKRSVKEEKQTGESTQTNSGHKVRHHHGRNPSLKTLKRIRRRKERCKRYAQRYYQPNQGVPVYVPKYVDPNYIPQNYVPRQYVVPSYYPSICRPYCVPCGTPGCRRICPNTPDTKTTGKITTAVTKSTTKPTATITVLTKSPCDHCSEDGSIFPCDGNGACICKPNYTGSTCDICKNGYWKNKNRDCVKCNCNYYGSIPNTYCNKNTGRCYCKEGVKGEKCDACKPQHYGTIETGCKACDDCDKDGSKYSTCDNSGSCICKPNYTGKTCNSCKEGYWKNKNKDCVKCNCNEYGTLSNTHCNQKTSKCYCKPGVTGDTCNVCKPMHYGTIETGCKECDPCDKPGHLCDPQNGKCVCPPLTGGENCQHCVENAWGYERGHGCKPCECSPSGSSSLQCDQIRGVCSCKIGYEGEKCSQCTFSYYGYPTCKKCDCDSSGTAEENCQGEDCRCTANGNCKCKENVQGIKCDTCKPKTFGLTNEKHEGCTSCFCFGRSDTCTDAGFNWDKIRAEKMDNANQVIGADYWKLPTKFMGDLTSSYGGYLSVNMKSGYFRIILEGNGVQLQSSGSKELQLVEDKWNIISRNSQFPSNCDNNLSRSCFMVVLQNVTSFLVEANDRIQEVLLDKAKPNIPTYSSSHTVEKCECPKEYTGLSCQDPNEGYFRYFSNDPKDSWIDLTIGKAKPCECNGKSQFCDPNTGYCKNCTQNSTGNHCESCNTGYYKDSKGNCSPCLCPTASQNNAESCSAVKDSFICNCKKGYEGQFCNTCAKGYFNIALRSNFLICEPCNCNPFGVVNGETNICGSSGICKCNDGFKGEKCDECVNEREFIKNGICTPCDECTKLLFAEIDNLTLAVEDTYKLFQAGVSPPWKILTSTIDKHHLLSEKFKVKEDKVKELLENANITQLEEKVNGMQKELENNKNEATANTINSNKLGNSTNALTKRAEELREELIKTIEALDSFGAKPISIKNALKKAREILKQIEAVSKKFNKEKDQEAFQFCANITEKVNEIYKPPLNIPNQLLKDLQDKLEDLINIGNSIERVSNKADVTNQKNRERIRKLKENIEKFEKTHNDTETSVKQIMLKINATDDLVHKLEALHDDLKNAINSMEHKQLENRIRRQMDENSDINKLFLKVIDHVRELETTVNEYQSIFNFTKDEWKKINASGAYETLLDEIKEARKQAELSREILEIATKLLNPEGQDNVVDKTNLAQEYSDRLKKKISGLKDLSKSLDAIKRKLDKFKYSILESGKANNDLNQILHNMETDLTSQEARIAKLEEAIGNSTDISENMKEIEKRIEDMLVSSKENFFNKYNDFLNLLSKDEIDQLKSKVKDTRKYLENLNITTTDLDVVKTFNIEIKNKNMEALHAKIEALKNKVNYAKQAADTISVPLNISNCRMSYQLPQTELFQSLSIIYKCKTCQLFKLSNSEGEFDVAVSKFNIVLKFNDKEMTISDTNGNKEKTLNIQKLGSLIKMEVDTVSKSIVTDSPYYFVHPTDLIVIGGTNSKTKSYVYTVTLNEKKIGLWKFTKTEGNCTGETRDESGKQPPNVNIFYNGKGYATYGKNDLNPKKISLGFDLATFDENSLIYLAAINETASVSEQDNCAFIALFLKNGHLNLIVRHSNGFNVTLTLDNKFNNGRKHQAKISMEFVNNMQTYILLAKNETFEENKNSTNILNRKNVFKVKQAFHYVGGVPPIFNKTCIPFNITSFLGFLKLNLATSLTNEIISYGITETNKQNLEFYQIWLNKNGYVKILLNTKKIDSISFIVRPSSANGIIMNLVQYNITLSNYKLKIEGLNGDHNINLNKNEYNTVNISINKGTVTVNKNENVVSFSDEITIEDSFITIGDRQQGFKGGLNNILVNNEEVQFSPDTVVEFSNVEIGREPLDTTYMSTNFKTMLKAAKSLSTYTKPIQKAVRCASLPDYKTDPNTVKFDDSNNYTHITTNFWKNDYSLVLQFRTVYPNGLIFVSSGKQKQQHFNLLKLKDGQLGFHFKGKKKQEMYLKGKLNDGQWHKVELIKKKRKLTIIVDDRQNKTSKIPKTVVKNEIYLGGYPPSSDYSNINNAELLVPFKGCMKSIVINGKRQLKQNRNRKAQCFSNIEEGLYFGGKTFAIIKHSFKIKKIPKVSFEFRSTEQNGILLSTSTHDNSPALSIELQNGAIVMAVDIGNGVISNTTNDLVDDFALCNNAWHTVTAMYEYSNLEMKVVVDGIQKIWVQSDINLFDEIDASLYIGGIPENAPLGTLKSRTNFNGCIRNLRIDDELIDWSNIEKVNDVSNSCPV